MKAQEMALDYLDFEYSEDEDGNGSWDAMASVTDNRWTALLEEVSQVLQWAVHDFPGRRASLDDGGDWDYDLSAQEDDSGRTLDIRWDKNKDAVHAEMPQAGSYTTLTLTLTGNATFGNALRQAFALD